MDGTTKKRSKIECNAYNTSNEWMQNNSANNNKWQHKMRNNPTESKGSRGKEAKLEC